MKKIFILMLLTMTPFLGQSQEMYKISFDSHQHLGDGTASLGSKLKLPTTTNTIVLGGLNDLDGMGAYVSIYGSKLIVDSLDLSPDGTKHVILRREDGRDFYDLFPTLSARLIPMTLIEKEELFND